MGPLVSRPVEKHLCPRRNVNLPRTVRHGSAGHSVWVRPGLAPIPEVKPHVVRVVVRCESSREALMLALFAKFTKR